MKPVAIISTDTSPDYLFLLPIVAKSWELQGFYCYIIVNGENPSKLWMNYTRPDNCCYQNTNEYIESTNKALFSQCWRMYAMLDFQNPEQYVILSDVDMFIASSFLYRDFDKVNVFGHDLTGFEHVPICYVGATVAKWVEIMKVPEHEFIGLDYDLYRYAEKNSDVPGKAWCADQDILTAKLKLYGFDKINFINRGIDPKNLNLPLGRWDRYGGFKKPQGEIHDVHLMRDPTSEKNFKKILEMCETVYPNENWNWIIQYRREFMKEYQPIA